MFESPTPPPGNRASKVSWRRKGRSWAAAALLGWAATAALAATPPERSKATPPTPAEINVQDFDFMVDKVTQNYAGWDHKVTDVNRADLSDLTQRLRARAASSSPAQMEALLGEWIAFFKDGHLRVNRNTDINGDAPNTAPNVERPQAWSDAAVLRRLSQLGRTRSPVEGIWRINDDRYRVAVLRDEPATKAGAGAGAGAVSPPQKFQAVVLGTTATNWRPGQIKASLVRQASGAFALVYRLGNHAELDLQGKLVANDALLSLDKGLGAWTREWPAARDPDEAARLFPVEELFLRRLSATTLWLRIPDFNDRRAATVKALLADNAEVLNTTPNLVLDLRNNGGGSDHVYAPLLPLAYTRPIYSIGIELRASADNIALRREVMERVKTSPQTVAQLEAEIHLMEKNVGRYVRPGALPFEITHLNEVRAFPKRMAVLIDGAGSTGEQLLLDLRQSAKVTLMGQRNSAGVLDFANVVGLVMPSGRFDVQWATSRSLRLPNDPVDPDGIAPDVRIPNSVQDPVTYARQWLEKQPP
jgi:Peptidase family S41